MMKLQTGTKYDTNKLACTGWTEGDGSGHYGYNVSDYFATDGTYRGADEHGIEPEFTEATGDYSNYSIRVSLDPEFWGSGCNPDTVEETVATFCAALRKQFPGLEARSMNRGENYRHGGTFIEGPDEAVCEEIDRWFDKNWTSL